MGLGNSCYTDSMHIYRQIEPEDAQHLMNWFNKIVAQDRGVFQNAPVSLSEEEAYVRQQLELIRSGQLVSLVAIDNHPVVGKIDVLKGQKYVDAHVGTILFGLLPGHEAMGEELILEAMEQASTINIELLVYNQRSCDPMYAPIFERVGFKKVGHIPRYYHKHNQYCDRIIYSRSL